MVSRKHFELKVQYITSCLIYDIPLNITKAEINKWSLRGRVISLVNILLVLSHVPAVICLEWLVHPSLRMKRLAFSHVNLLKLLESIQPVPVKAAGSVSYMLCFYLISHILLDIKSINITIVHTIHQNKTLMITKLLFKLSDCCDCFIASQYWHTILLLLLNLL